MGYCFRVRFTVPSKGSFTTDEESIAFSVPYVHGGLKLSSATQGLSIGQSDRLTVSGGPFELPEQAETTAESVRAALLHRAVLMRRGIDLGQLSINSFSMSDYGKELLATNLKVAAVQEDHLGITIYSDNPKPHFLGLNAQGLVSYRAEKLVDELVDSIGRWSFKTKKAEISSGIYAFSHFVGRAPARFLILFVCLEALFDAGMRSDEAQVHVQNLIQQTLTSSLSTEEMNAIASSLSFLKQKSIHQTGRELAAALLPGKRYRSMLPNDFFSYLYKIRNKMVHKGSIDPEQVHDLLGDFDQFISDMLLTQHVETRF